MSEISDILDTMSYKRTLKLSLQHSFILLGPRGTGKSTLLDTWKTDISDARSNEKILILDLLDPDCEERYSVRPGILKEEINERKTTLQWVVIDEAQKIPQLLDVAQWAIQKHKIYFAITGSSVRKLKRGSANLLAGRAHSFNLHTLTREELGNDFNLDEILKFGSLPEVFSLHSELEKKRYLKSYCQTYLREEIQLEQIVRNMQRFRKFLNFASQMNGEILNFSKISRISTVDEKSISRYFEILIDTMVGFYLESYDGSIRKQQSIKPKFYFFDTGVTRALDGTLNNPLNQGDSYYGKLFEQWFITECIRLNDYYELDYKFSYLRTKEDAEIDLIVEKPNGETILIEIKSALNVVQDDIRHLKNLKNDFGKHKALVVSQEPSPRLLDDGIRVVHWEAALKELFIANHNIAIK